jgi:hypothetical protein
VEHLSPEDRRRTLTPDEDDEDALHPHELEVSLIDLTAFLYSACQDASIRFEQLIESGVYEAYPDHHRDRVLRGVSVDVDYEERDLLAKTAWIDWQDGEPLSPGEAGVLMQSDEFDSEDLSELRERVRQWGEGGSALKRERENPRQPQFGPSLDESTKGELDEERDFAEAIGDDRRRAERFSEATENEETEETDDEGE